MTGVCRCVPGYQNVQLHQFITPLATINKKYPPKAINAVQARASRYATVLYRPANFAEIHIQIAEMIVIIITNWPGSSPFGQIFA